ncbi:MAG: hypothetical protein UR27_C0015G0042 [Candidatus Peregrinibacteria bacterium GW2011_GWA2_33_10]|nr:MAG: hypothetical protein UR27_C0015G0042 [Candidatus Peregrinibacteria bacterium GW2011_GWA2_33_10]KKP39544.1 MAG: hypothetical protein UR30_C0010G0040 [Candidatus Peregrinibacteria bacterium GW2011_GWC2_33_13]
MFIEFLRSSYLIDQGEVILNIVYFIFISGIFILLLWRSIILWKEKESRKPLFVSSLLMITASIINMGFKIRYPYYKDFAIILLFFGVCFFITWILTFLKSPLFSIKKRINLSLLTLLFFSSLGLFILMTEISYFKKYGIINAVNLIYETHNKLSKALTFPAQKFVLQTVTKIELTSRKDKYITDEEIKNVRDLLEPGDILLKRNELQVTNIGIPGFWTHSGIYFGSLEKLDDFFKDVDFADGKNFSDILKEKNLKVFKKLSKNKDLEIIESIASGVVFNPLEHIGKVDYFSALRPNIEKEEKAQVLLNAFSFLGLPYDYDFDFATDDSFICTEVLYKAYKEFISFDLINNRGRFYFTPNDIVRKFDLEFDSKTHVFDFVIFVDYDSNLGKSYENSADNFRKSWMRDYLL